MKKIIGLLCVVFAVLSLFLYHKFEMIFQVGLLVAALAAFVQLLIYFLGDGIAKTILMIVICAVISIAVSFGLGFVLNITEDQRAMVMGLSFAASFILLDCDFNIIK